MDAAWIKEQIAKHPEKTQVALAEALGIDPAGVSRMLHGERQIKARDIPIIEQFFGEVAPTARRSEAVIAGDAAGRVSSTADMPVYGAAEGGPQGSMVLDTNPVDHAKRPEPLFNVRGAFGMYVVGDSMSPAYETGDMLLIHPGKPVRGGDDCIFVQVREDGGQYVLVKRLLRFTAEQWRVKQYNPARDFDLKRADWQQAMLIVGKYARR